MTVLIGAAAAVLTSVCWLPQVVRTFRHKHSAVEHLTWLYLSLLSVGVALWCIYGIMRSDPPIYVCNAFVFVCLMVVLVMKVHAAVVGAHSQKRNIEVADGQG